MRNIIFNLLILGTVAGATVGQVPLLQHGDLVVTYYDASTFQSGGAFAVDPQTGACTMLAPAPTGSGFRGARMDEKNDHVVTGQAGMIANYLMRIDRGGNLSTWTTLLGKPCKLDHDDRWVVYGSTAHQDHLYLLQNTTNSLTTIFSGQRPGPAFGGSINDLAVDRDQTALAPYVIARWHTMANTLTVRLEGIDRTGNTTTIYSGTGNPLRWLQQVELDPATGDYLACGAEPPPSTQSGVWSVDKTGRVKRTLLTSANITIPGAAKIDHDGTAWIVGRSGTVSTMSVFQMDMVTNPGAILRTIPIPPLQFPNWPTGVEVYGCRPLVCSQPTASPVSVNLQSIHPLAPGANYVLAASFAQRPPSPTPCLKFSNGEYLFLDTTGPLFNLSVLNLVPGLFQGFRGFLNLSGKAAATVNIPWQLQGAGITIFVAGVIYNQSNVLEVTNTHWFVL